MIEINNLMVFFENSLAINDLSLEVHKEEVVGVLGSNSAGKTTLMNTISGLMIDIKKKEDRRGGERITILGEIKFEGKDIMNTPADERVKKGIVLSRERHPIFPDSTIEENLRIAAYLRRDTQMKKAFESIYSIFSHLKDIRKRKAGFCSGGEQQMLAIGMTLMTRPRLLLMDEPLLGLSPLLQKDLTRAIKQIRGEGVTLLVTEQFARPLLPIIDRGYVIENGTLVLFGTGQELMDNPEVKAAYFGI
ncbi:MAG TPA: ABC transporter ATP-binding protein [Thermodesulfobacteriota bacterium]|nr:ABC transporter ATP-binding protein [Thermodesulfobacteriota bacterium]